MWDPLSDCRPLISAAVSGKLRLVRLLVEGGAQVNACNPEGETALLAACKILRGEPAGPETVKLLTYLLKNKADPNAQDQAGRTALMYTCMERAGEQVASILLAAGADPSMEDQFGASALVYAINAHHQPTLKVLMDACQAKGRDIIIIATETDVNGGPVTRRYLNVPPSPNTSPVSCMSPSDIVLKTGSPNSPKGENIFNFRGAGKQGSSSSSRRLPSCEPSPLSQSRTPAPRHRVLSEPWLAIHNLNQAHEEGMRMEGDQDEHEEPHFHEVWMEERRDHQYTGENYINSWPEDFALRGSQSLLSLTEMSSSQEIPGRLPPKKRGATSDTKASSVNNLSSCSHRRNTLPSVMVFPPPLHLPPLVNQSDSHLQVPPSKSRSMLYLPHPPGPSQPSSCLSRASVRQGFLPPLQLASSITSLVNPPASCCNSGRGRQSLRRHSVQLEQL